MERLTERTEYGIVGNNKKVTNYPLYKVAKYDELDHGITGQCFEKLAYYEDLDEQGLLLRLPCKVGDTVYCIRTLMDFQNAKIQREVIVEKFRLEMLCDIGYAYFLTKAEAEQKLKEMENR